MRRYGMHCHAGRCALHTAQLIISMHSEPAAVLPLNEYALPHGCFEHAVHSLPCSARGWGARRRMLAQLGQDLASLKSSAGPVGALGSEGGSAEQAGGTGGTRPQSRGGPPALNL